MPSEYSMLISLFLFLDSGTFSREEALQPNFSIPMGMNTERRGSKSDLSIPNYDYGASHVKQRQDSLW